MSGQYVRNPGATVRLDLPPGIAGGSKVAAATTILCFGREGIELHDLAARVEALESAAPQRVGAMAMNLKRRLGALERVAVATDAGICDACGYSPESELKFEVSFDDEPRD